jgi:hypothetical protein
MHIYPDRVLGPAQGFNGHAAGHPVGSQNRQVCQIDFAVVVEIAFYRLDA